jgi:Flp pilus assembly protein TadG
VELALVTPFLLLLLLGAIDLGRLFYAYIGIENAAREGAAFGAQAPTCWSAPPATHACASPGNVEYHARQEMGGNTGPVVAVLCATSCSSTSNTVANTITVSVVEDFHLIVTGFFGGTLTLRSSATAAIQ